MTTTTTLVDLYIEAYRDVESAGLPVADFNKINVLYNQRLGGAWGNCTDHGGGRFTVRFSKTLCQHTSENSILNTMAHELIHACGIRGHKRDFKLAGQRLMAKFPGKYNVSRCTGAEEKMDNGQMMEAYKYIIGCPKCGMKWGYQRFSRAVQNVDFCTCPKCHSHLDRIK